MFLRSGKYDYLVAGLGNPGPRYENTRHNVGFRAADRLLTLCEVKTSKKRFNAVTYDASLQGKSLLVIKPETFMNSSGEAVRAAARFYKIPPEKIIVLCDDISFTPGVIRVRKNGSDGGHNGLKSIIEQLGSSDFMRVRIGVGAKPQAFDDLADWVLSQFSDDENKALEPSLENAANAVKSIVSGKIEDAMNRYNRKASS
ncbi:MAG: aminoacyl-tRNA hydrolase [Clostridia bacterium]|nr:aminoacyl-tRNA hydrolase [Clostridia bacterium]